MEHLLPRERLPWSSLKSPLIGHWWVQRIPPTLPTERQPSLVGLAAGTVICMEQDNIQDIADVQTDATEAVVTEELLVEEISIDGMCGVY